MALNFWKKFDFLKFAQKYSLKKKKGKICLDHLLQLAQYL